MGVFDEREDRPRSAPIIEDKRHLRDEDEEGEAEVEQPEQGASGQAEPAAAETVPADAASAVAAAVMPELTTPVEELAKEQAEPVVAAAGDGVPADMPTEEELAQLQQAEYQYLMQLFQLGLPGYLRSQLGILLNFALINLGRAPNPSTGLVTADLDQAKLAIDTMEFVFLRVQAGMQAQERAELGQWLNDLKYTFMQAISGAAGAVKAGDGEA